ncbi:ACT domain-containing protein [Actinocrinis puniceicyclus]|uniref:ACT domain-containing protein n=1 Tax=Actinocrinis puniceicyclus TaxID=977794 RepID=A0A8J7WVY8_9ACTN|nr:ACT domain-containing protein [Actinocrinis puniceicyclus]MBS2966124.1 ACT domain-containing protein [Actinocrinis puniceicyclus]
MLLRLRIWVADRPGALGQVTRELGACGADIVQVSVLSRERGRALDEITVFLPEQEQRDRLERALRALTSVTVEGIRPSGEVPGAFPDLDLLGRVAADPRAALNLLAEALPRILAADWAVVVPAGAGGPLPAAAVTARSWSAPREIEVPQLPQRAAAVSVGGTRYACAPVGESGLLLVVARIGDPAFHRFEVMRLARVTQVAAAIAGSRLGARAPASSAQDGS